MNAWGWAGIGIASAAMLFIVLGVIGLWVLGRALERADRDMSREPK